jgi:hypothetical protein
MVSLGCAFDHTDVCGNTTSYGDTDYLHYFIASYFHWESYVHLIPLLLRKRNVPPPSSTISDLILRFYFCVLTLLIVSHIL